MTYLLPSAFWGLLGLSIPIIIHLFSRSKRTKINFGSIAFLEETSSTSRSSIKLSQHLLLLFRLIFISILCWLMARPTILNNSQSKTYLIEDKIWQNPNYQSVLKSLDNAVPVETFTFEFDSSQNHSYYHSLWQLIHQANKRKDSLVIYSFSELKNAIGTPVRLFDLHQWIVVPQADQKVNRGLFTALVSDRKTVFEGMIQNQQTKLSADTLQIHLGDPELVQMKNMVNAIGEKLAEEIIWIESDVQADCRIISNDSLIWTNIPTIHYKKSSERLSFDIGPHRIYFINGLISPLSLLQSNLPVLLTDIITHKRWYDRNIDHRTLPAQMLSASMVSDQYPGIDIGKKKEINRIWWLLLILILLTERVISYNSKNNL